MLNDYFIFSARYQDSIVPFAIINKRFNSNCFQVVLMGFIMTVCLHNFMEIVLAPAGEARVTMMILILAMLLSFVMMSAEIRLTSVQAKPIQHPGLWLRWGSSQVWRIEHDPVLWSLHNIAPPRYLFIRKMPAQNPPSISVHYDPGQWHNAVVLVWASLATRSCNLVYSFGNEQEQDRIISSDKVGTCVLY